MRRGPFSLAIICFLGKLQHTEDTHIHNAHANERKLPKVQDCVEGKVEKFSQENEWEEEEGSDDCQTNSLECS